MGKRYAINIGVANSDSIHYGSSRPFEAAKKSSEYLQQFFRNTIGFDCSQLIQDEAATTERITSELKYLETKMNEGDLLVISFSGHTYKVRPDDQLTNAQNEDRGWGIYDRIFFHFEIWQCLQHFRPGTRIIIIADSCYSGITGAEFVPDTGRKWFDEKNLKQYNNILINSGKPLQFEIAPSVVVMTASNKDQEIVPSSYESDRTVFSVAFTKAWNRKKEQHTLSSFFDDIVWFIHMAIAQQPDIQCDCTKLEHKDIHRRRATPQWHYNQGHKYTKLRTQVPAFKATNF